MGVLSGVPGVRRGRDEPASAWDDEDEAGSGPGAFAGWCRTTALVDMHAARGAAVALRERTARVVAIVPRIVVLCSGSWLAKINF